MKSGFFYDFLTIGLPITVCMAIAMTASFFIILHLRSGITRVRYGNPYRAHHDLVYKQFKEQILPTLEKAGFKNFSFSQRVLFLALYSDDKFYKTESERQAAFGMGTVCISYNIEDLK